MSENSPIQQVGDLKGKKLGVASFGTVEQQVGSYMLKQRGIDPEKDVTWTAVGEGNTGQVALTRGDVDAMIYFYTGFGGWDAANLKYPACCPARTTCRRSAASSTRRCRL